MSEKTERRFDVILAPLSSSFNLIYSISHLYFMYKLSFLLHSLLDNGARMTPKRRSVFSLIFIVKG